MKRLSRPFSLVDTELQTNLPQRHRYGGDHTPSLSEILTERLSAYHEVTTYLQEAFTRYDGLYVLTAFLLLRFGSGRRDRCETDLTESEVELAQALFLKYGGGRDIPTISSIKEIKHKLKLHMLLFLEATSKPDDSDRANVLSRRRSETLHVRHTFYPNQAYRIHSAIAAEIDGARLRDFDLTVAEVSLIAFLLAEYLTKAVGPFVSPCEDWLEGKKSPDFNTWLQHFWIPIELLAKAIKKSEEKVNHLLKEWSHEPGSVVNTKLEYLHLDNPLWGRPLVSSGGRFSGFNPNVFLAFHSDILSTVLTSRIPKFSEKLGQARGTVLEHDLHALLPRMIPSGEILQNAKWTDPADDRKYESDAIVLIDELMLIFEAKGGALDPKSRRGSQTLMDDLQKLFAEAAVQSHRLRDVFYSGLEALEFRIGTDTKTIRHSDVKRVARFGVEL